MACILSIETSTNVCSIAVHLNGILVALSEVHIDQSHASKLPELVRQTLSGAGVSFSGLQAVAVSSGPGSYTGLRIGTSTAKGIAYALSIPIIAVTSLEILASQMNSYNTGRFLLCPMIDARRMEVYCALFDSELSQVLPTQAMVIDNNSFNDVLSVNSILFFGNGAQKCKGVIEHPNAFFIPDVYPSASKLGDMALKKYNTQSIENLENFEPFYLKDFVAKSPSKSIL